MATKSKRSTEKMTEQIDEVVTVEVEEPKNIVMNNQTVGTTTQKFAQMLDFAALQNILTQNVSKTQNKTYTQYTKEKLITYIQSPLANLDNIRDVSQYIWRISPNYRTLINYYATMPLYSYNVVYNSDDWTKKIKYKDFMADYQTLCKRLENMNLRDLSPKIIATSMRDGMYVGFCYDDENSFFISDLDPKYCKVSGITENNTYIVKFNAAYFDAGSNKEFLYGVNDDGQGTWDKVFVQGYETYKNDGRDFQWFELPPERTICVVCGDDPLVPLPFFTAIFQSLLDLLDYQDLIRSKTELENYVLLLSKVPLIKNSEEVNDFAVDLDLVRLAQQMIDTVAPSLVATAWSPCEVEPIFFNNKNQVEDTNIYSTAIQNLFESIGVSQMLFNGEKAGSVGLRHSIRVDESLVFTLMAKLEANIQRYIKLNIFETFNFYYHRATGFSQDEYAQQLQNMATLGLPCKTDLATLYKTPFAMMNATYMENALGLDTLWQPLASSYTQTDNKGGGQKKSDDELSDEGLDSRDSGKNEGTKAKG